MARNRVIVETIICDICGREIDTAISCRLAVNKDAWDLDLCEDDARSVDAQIEQWVANARKASTEARRSPARQSKDDWEYLESLGFKRHRGRKTPAETAALANRR
jgi:ribosome-binding protein aMBF1 (putative translation factor)